MQDEIILEQGGGLRREGRFHPGQEDLPDVALDLRAHRRVGLLRAEARHGFRIGAGARFRRREFIVLGGEDDRMDAHRPVVPVVLDGELRFGVGAQVRHELRFVVADVGQDAERQVRQVQRQGHVVFRIAAGVAEHHALVAGALVLGLFAADAAADVAALLVDGGKHTARIAVEHVFRLVVADTLDGVAHDGLDVDIGIFRADFAADDHQSGGAEGFTGNVCVRVLAEEFVKDGV